MVHIPAKSATGEKYIYIINHKYQFNRGHVIYYRVDIERNEGKHQSQFLEMKDAITFRDAKLVELGLMPPSLLEEYNNSDKSYSYMRYRVVI